MGLLNRLQTGALVRNDPGLMAEQRRFATLFASRMDADPEADYTDGQPLRDDDDAHESRREVRNEADSIFLGFWEDVTEAYAAARTAANVMDHNRFTALLNRQAPYAQYDYRGLLRTHVLGDITARRHELTAHWAK